MKFNTNMLANIPISNNKIHWHALTVLPELP